MTMAWSLTGIRYRPVTHTDLLKAVLDARRAEDVGEELWPHLHGRGSTRGGPSSCYVTAARMLGKLRKQGLVRQWFLGRDHRWQITDAGRDRLAKITAELPTGG